MKSLSSFILISLMVILGVEFLSVILTSLFIGSGYIISFLYKFTLFNATALCIGVTFVSSFIIFISIYCRYEDNKSCHSGTKNDDCDCPVCTFRHKLENKNPRRHKSK